VTISHIFLLNMPDNNVPIHCQNAFCLLRSFDSIYWHEVKKWEQQKRVFNKKSYRNESNPFSYLSQYTCFILISTLSNRKSIFDAFGSAHFTSTMKLAFKCPWWNSSCHNMNVCFFLWSTWRTEFCCCCFCNDWGCSE